MSGQPELLGDGIAGGGLRKDTNWWGAFVIGLAGTILVTGITPLVLTSWGAAGIPIMALITVTGYLLCLLLAELSAMMPDRTGGSPTYAMVGYRDWGRGVADHINGVTCWAYWLGWFPVAPLNMILASAYLTGLLDLPDWGTFHPVSTPITGMTMVIAIVGIVGLFIPAYLGIRLGAGFATVLGLLSMIPLTFIGLAGLFKADWGNLSGFEHLDGSGFFSSFASHGWPLAMLAIAFPISWNVIAMEAAACYIGECSNPARDAKIAMNAEGAYGAFVYVMIPTSFVLVLGNAALGDPSAGLVDPKTMFVTFAGKVFSSTGSALNWTIGLMLIVALALSALNAIMGCSRGLHQISIDGQFPRVFARVNVHGVPSFAMGFTVVASLLVVLLGGAAEIYTFSNVGYLGSFLPVLLAYYLLRRKHPEIARPVRLPGFFKWIALAMFALYSVIWLVGGLVYASFPYDFNFDGQIDGDNRLYYFLGWVVIAAYVLFWWWRRVEDRRHGDEGVRPLSDVESSYLHDK